MSSSHLEPRVELLAHMDVAAIVSGLQLSVGGASRHDIHLFGYLSSMAYSQTGSAPSTWGYPFAASKQGLPFSDALDYATDRMLSKGELNDVEDGLQLADSFAERFELIARGDAFGERIGLVRDVCTVVVFRTLPGIGRALRAEPQLSRSAELKVVRLIDENELSRTLMDLMLKVRDQLPQEFPPSGPTMLWLDEWERQNAN